MVLYILFTYRLHKHGGHAGRVTDARRSGLGHGDVDRQPVQRFGQPYLACQAAVGPGVDAARQHFLLLGRGNRKLVLPSVADITVTGRAGHRAAAFADDPGHQVIRGATHCAIARFGRDGVFDAQIVDENDTHQASPLCFSEGLHPQFTRPAQYSMGEFHF